MPRLKGFHDAAGRVASFCPRCEDDVLDEIDTILAEGDQEYL